MTRPDGQLCEPSGKAAALLAFLISRADSPNSVNDIIKVVWPKAYDPELVGRRRVEQVVSEVRDLLKPFGRVVIPPRQHDRYRLVTSTDILWVDSVEFDRLGRAARAALESGDAAEARLAAVAALALWKADPVVVPAHWKSLHERRREVRLTAAEASLVNSDSDEAATSLSSIVHDYPDNERGWQLLVQALAASGRLGDARRACADARVRFAELGGIAPQLSRICDDLTSPGSEPLPTAAAEQRAVVPEPGAETVTTDGSRASQRRPVRALPALRPTLGRAKHLRAAVAKLNAGPPVPTLVLGAPGIGKTNLVVAILHHRQVAEAFGPRRWFVRCEAATSAYAVLVELARVLDLPLVGADPSGAVMAALGDAPGVLALDNAETPWEADTLATEELFAQMAGVPGVALVASLRGVERPGGPAWGSTVVLSPLPEPEARGLFLSIAGKHFDTAGLDAVLAEMGGVPLAIELLAHVAEGEPDAASLGARWRAERVQLLEKGRADHRLLSVGVSVEASWGGPLMTVGAQRLLSMLGALPDGVAHCDLAPLMAGVGAAGANVLRRRGLAFDESVRLRTYPPIRHHMAVAHPPTDEDLHQAAHHYARLAIDLGQRVGDRGGHDAAARLLAEMANLQAMLPPSLAGPDPTEALDAVHALTTLVRHGGVGSGGLFEDALAAARRVSDDGRTATALLDRGDIAFARSDHDGARAFFEDSLALYRREGDVVGEAKCIMRLGDIALRHSDRDGALRRFDEALVLFRRVGAEWGEANCITRLGNLALERSDYDGARARYEEALPLCRRADNYWGEANCTKGLGNIALARLNLDRAKARYEEALRLYQRAGIVLGEANCIYGLGNVALQRSDTEEARVRYEAALLLYRRLGSVVGEGNCIQGLGDIAVQCLEHDIARRAFTLALRLYERIPDPSLIGGANRRLARMAGSDTERDAAVAGARTAWAVIGREDLLAQLAAEFRAHS